MRYLIIGILAVLCLEIGFTTYLSNTYPTRGEVAQNSGQTIKAETGVLFEPDLIETVGSVDAAPAPVHIERADASSKADASPAISVKERKNIDQAQIRSHSSVSKPQTIAETKPRRVQKAVTDDRHNAAKRSPLVRQNNEPFKSTVITYRPSQSSQTAGMKIERAEKRTVAAILKKPVSWVKSLGSKMF